MPYLSKSVYTYAVSGGITGPFSYSFSTLDPSVVPENDQIHVSLNGTDLVEDTDYTIDTDLNQVTLTDALVSGDTLVIYRQTQISSRHVDYEDGSQLNEFLLDLDSDQEFQLIQELDDQFQDVMHLDGTLTCWDADGKKICNLADGTLSTDAATVGQLTDQVSTEVLNAIVNSLTANLLATGIHFLIATPAVGAYKVMLHSEADWAIEEVVCAITSGTSCTLRILNNGTPVTFADAGTTVTTVEGSKLVSSNNTVSAGNYVSIDVTAATGSPANLSVSILGTRIYP